MLNPSRSWYSYICGSFIALGFFAAAIAGEPPKGDVGSWDEARQLTRWIDGHLSDFWERGNIVPAAPAGDAQWLRRVSLDLSGVIPSVWEVREFLADGGVDRYERAVDGLLDGPAHATHFASVWTAAMMPEVDTNPNFRGMKRGTQLWMRNRFVTRQGYDEIVRELITYPLDRNAARDPYQRRGSATPAGFFFVKGNRPEKLAASTARMFLGLQIGCAECHDHPFSDWKQEEFWQLAAFYASLRRQNPENDFSQVQEDKSIREIGIGETETVVQAAFLDGSQPQWTADDVPREVLAEWLTSPDNDYFARAAVNRVWALLLGTGLVDPVDNFDPINPPSHPLLLEHLAGEFIAHDFDIQFLLRALVTTRAYRLSSEVTDPTQRDRTAFAAMPVRGMSPEQLYESLARAIGMPKNAVGRGYGNPLAARAKFLEVFKNQADTTTEYETSILQALTLLNGSTVAGATNLQNSRTLAAVVDYPELTTADQVETLFLTTLSRPPTAEESQRLASYVDGGGAVGESKQALADVFWALLNSSEFTFNH